jgi:hypothetical protein
MSPTDFITLLGIGIAVWALIPSKERRFILLFFSKGEIIAGAILVAYLHFLMSFDWLLLNWWGWLSIFTTPRGIPPTSWAYILALLIISYPIIKIKFGFFSRQRQHDLIELYASLISSNEIDLVATYVEKYHVSDIEAYLKNYSKLPEVPVEDIFLNRRTKADDEHEKILNKKRASFAWAVYKLIVVDERFIYLASNKYPLLFARILYGMESERAANPELVKSYIGCLFRKQNKLLIGELKVLSKAYDSILSRNNYEDVPIMSSLLNNTKVAHKNQIWYPVGEDAVKSIKYNKKQKSFLEKLFDNDLKDQLWNCKVFTGIVYFNYMVRECIYRDSGWHMWLFYYRTFVSEIIKNIPNENTYNLSVEYPSFNHYLLCEMVDYIIDWLNLAAEENTEARVIDSIRCLGSILDSICNCEVGKISEAFKEDIIEKVLTLYFELSSDEVKVIELIEKRLEFMFKNPKNPDHGTTEVTHVYIVLLQNAWAEFDKVPYSNLLIRQFTINVLVPLGIAFASDETLNDEE